MKKVVLFLCIMIVTGVVSAMPQRDAARIKQEKQQTSRQIKDTSKKLDENTLKVSRQLNQLNFITAEIAQYNDSIAVIAKIVDETDRSIKSLNDSIATLNRNIGQLQEKYALAVRKMRSRQGEMSTLAFIFSAESFTQAYRRMRYLRQFSKWRARKAEEIKSAQLSLGEQQAKLVNMRSDKSRLLSQLESVRAGLQMRLDETKSLVANLEREGKTLKKFLKEKEKQAQALDEELDRLIEQQRIAEEKRRQEEARRLADERRRQETERQRLAQEEKRRNDSILAQKSKQKTSETETPQVPNKPKQESESPKPQKENTETAASKKVDLPDNDKLTVEFKNAKGKLIFPVAGVYSIVRGFGINQHPRLKYVKTNNSGIDVEVAQGTKARAVFHGRVSAIFRQPGFNNIVMIRHGNYITIYTNLNEIYVRKGDAVEAGSEIGEIYSDPGDDNRTILHFEIRDEKEKLNPVSWLKMK